MRELTIQEIDHYIMNDDFVCLYLYTPLCGTCQVASKMLMIVSEILPTLPLEKCDLNYIPSKAIEWGIESVPCLLLFHSGSLQKKIYAFHSVPYLLETLHEWKPSAE